MRRASLAVLVLGAVLATPAVAPAAPPKLLPYEVQAGDSCWSIAEKIFGDGSKYAVIHTYNDLGPLPHLLKRGQTLLLPADLARPDARVRTPRRDVRARPPRVPDWRKAYEDMALWRLFRVATGDDSSASIQFRDDSNLRMRDNALLVIHGGAAASAEARRLVKTTIELEKGTVRGGLARLDQAAGGVTIATPSSQVELHATSAQVEVAPDQTSLVCVYEGEADVSAQGATVTVPQEFGTAVPKGKRPERPRPLPPAPLWAEAPRDLVLVAAPDSGAAFEARWQPVGGAQRYRVDLARDERFRQVVVSAEVGAGVLQFRAEALGPGDYHAQVAAIDATRLEGPASERLRVRVVALQGSRRLEQGADGTLEAVGLVRLVPPPDAAADLEVALDEQPWVGAAEPVRLSEPGLHTLRYRSAADGQVSALSVRLLAVRGRIAPPDGPLRPGGAPVPLTLHVEDERGRPASLPGLTLAATPGGPLALAETSPGQYRAALLPPAGPAGGPVALAARWAGGELARAEVTVEGPPPSGPEPFAWPLAPAALEWARPAAGAPSRAARPTSQVGLSGVVAEAARSAGERPLFLRAALRGELALLDRTLGVDVDLPWFDADLAAPFEHRSELGDLRFGVRHLSLDRAGFALAPALRVTFPTGSFRRARDAFLFEPGLLFEWAWRDRLVLGTNQSLVVDTDFDGPTGLVYASTWAAVVRLGAGFSVAAELDAAIGLRGDAPGGAGRALAAGGALRLDLGQARIGLLGGAALNDDGRDRFGRFTAGLTLDVGFRGL